MLVSSVLTLTGFLPVQNIPACLIKFHLFHYNFFFLLADVTVIPNLAQTAPQSQPAGSPKQSSPSEIVSPQSKEVSILICVKNFIVYNLSYFIT